MGGEKEKERRNKMRKKHEENILRNNKIKCMKTGNKKINIYERREK